MVIALQQDGEKRRNYFLISEMILIMADGDRMTGANDCG
jgi:hypothetical protein